MSTPNEGPGRLQWPQGDAEAAGRAFAGLDAGQQLALNRVMNAVKAVGPIINGVARGIRVIRNTFTRLNELARRLTSTDRALTPPEQSQGGRHRAEQSPRLSMPTRESVVQARDTALGLARDVSMAAARGVGRGLAAGGRWAWSKGREGVSAVGQAAQVQANRAELWLDEKLQPVADKIDEKLAPVEQWADQKYAQGAAWAKDNYSKASTAANHQISRAAAKASAALAGLAANRMDPTLSAPGQKLEKRDVLLAQKSAELFTTPKDQQPAKAAELAAYLQTAYGNDAKVSLEKPAGPEQSVDAGARTAAASHELAWALNANPPANTMRPPSKSGPATPAAGEQPPAHHTKKEGPESTTPTRD
jgi:hypothetical protein